jgi:hypothetical protein
MCLSNSQDVGVSVELYPSQTKILEGRTKFQKAFFEALFNVVYPKSSNHTLEKCFPGKRTLKCLSDLPKSSFGEHKFVELTRCICVCRTHKMLIFFWKAVSLITLCREGPYWPNKMLIACRCVCRTHKISMMVACRTPKMIALWRVCLSHSNAVAMSLQC